MYLSASPPLLGTRATQKDCQNKFRDTKTNLAIYLKVTKVKAYI